jgi:hypothetical protein
MKPSLYYLEKGRHAILNLGYGLIELKSKTKKNVKISFNLFFQKITNHQRVLRNTVLEENNIGS